MITYYEKRGETHMKRTCGGVFNQNNCQVKPLTGGYYGTKGKNLIIYIHIRLPLIT